MISFAVNAISVFLLLLFFFCDKKSAIQQKFYKAKRNKLVVLYFVFFLIQCIGMLYTRNVEFGVQRLSVMVPILFLPLVVSVEKIDIKLFDFLLKVLVIWVVIQLLVFLFIHIYIDQRQYNNFVLYYLNDRLGISQFYISFILVIPILKIIHDIELKKTNLPICLLLGSVLLFFALLLGNITILVFLSLLIFIKTLTAFKGKPIYFKIVILILTCGLIGFGAFLTPKINEKISILLKTTDFNYEIIKTKHSVTFANNTLEQRVILNMSSIEIIKENFPFGVGTGDFKDKLLETYTRINFKTGLKQKFNNHNQFLSEFCKTGILGGVCFLLFFLYFFKELSLTSPYFTYVILLFFLGSMVESYLYRQHGVLIFSFILPLFLAYEKQRSNNRIKN
ncbi:O-antigen ligase family protein [Pseudotamlana carrageenivorans]|nr:O-antigen ligase family protein [Tamlana carrageenivorans]